jgi:transcriptional regulator with XRE-family HTH domain
VIKREVKLEAMLNSLIERGGYSRNRKPILDSINVTAAALSQYSHGRSRPSFDKLVALADFFDVSLDYLVYGEPTSTPVDPNPIARYVEQALMDVRGRTKRHSDLVAQIGGLIMDRIDDVAEEVLNSSSAGTAGLIEASEILRVERYSRQADVVATDLEPNIITLDQDKAAPGQFLPVVIENLMRGRTYRFLLAGDLSGRSPIVLRLREMIAEAVGGDRLHAYCFFRTSAWPIAGATVLYQLDRAAFEAEESALFTKFSNYLHGNTWLGYLNRPNESTSDILMDPTNVSRARHTFEALWTVATP